MSDIRIHHSCMVNGLIDLPDESEREEAEAVVAEKIEEYYDYLRAEAEKSGLTIEVVYGGSEWGSSYAADSDEAHDFMLYDTQNFWEWYN